MHGSSTPPLQVAKCTSSGVRVNGLLYHLRNMDWDMPVLRKVTVLTRFVKGGRLIHQVGFRDCECDQLGGQHLYVYGLTLSLEL